MRYSGALKLKEECSGINRDAEVCKMKEDVIPMLLKSSSVNSLFNHRPSKSLLSTL